MTSAAEFQTKVTKTGVNMDRLDGIVNGGPDTVVTTDNGDVPSLANMLANLPISDKIYTTVDTVAHLPASTGSDHIYLVTSDPTTANNGYWQDQSGGNVILTDLNDALRGADGADGIGAPATHEQLDAGSSDDVNATPAGLTYLGLTKARASQLPYLSLLITGDDDDGGLSVQGRPIALGFKEAVSSKARSFVLADGGFGAKRFTFLFGKQPADDDASAVIWGLSLDDGKMPIQADGRWRFFMKFQDRAVALMGAVLGFGLKSLWRGPASGTDQVITTNLMRARYLDAPTFTDLPVTPWRGELVMPRTDATTITLSSTTSHLALMQYIGQSNAGASGNDVTKWTGGAARFVCHALRFAGAGSYSEDGVAVLAANYGDLTPAYDVQGAAGSIWPHTTAAYLAHYRARMMGYEESPMLVRYDGYGGIPITWLLKAGRPGAVTGHYFYANAIETRKATKTKADAYGLNPDYHVVFIQGEDTSVATDLYQTYFHGLIDDHHADTITAVGKPLASFIIVQTNGKADATSNNPQGALAHIAETRARRGTDVALAGPMYQVPLDDTLLHATSVGRMMHADLCNRVRREIAQKGSFTPLDIARKAAPGLAVNQGLRGAGLAASTKITALGTGAGDTGTYTVNNSQLLGSAAAPVTFTAFGALFQGYIDNGSGSAGTTLTVTKILDGALDVAVSGASVAIRLNRAVRIDRDWVPDVGAALGWEWSDASSRTISNVDVSGDLVTLTLSGAPTGAMTLGYAISNCAAPYVQASATTGAGYNWAAPRGLIYADSGVSSTPYRLDPTFGPPTIRDYLVRLQETF